MGRFPCWLLPIRSGSYALGGELNGEMNSVTAALTGELNGETGSGDNEDILCLARI